VPAPTSSFGALLLRHRLAAGLSQQDLAERAELSPRGISDLERGVRRHPHPATARRLAAALGLDEADRAQLLDSRVVDGPGLSTQPLELAHVRVGLPRELTTFVGREHELQALATLMADAPMVTLAGPGGAGKTRLALRLARQLDEAGAYVDGVRLVELAPVTDARLVPRAVAEGLGVPEPSGQRLMDVLTRVLRSRQLLLVLDNCEHLVAACAEVASALLEACPGVRLLATSREPLRISGEVVYRIPPMQVPRNDRLESLADSEAARLFLLRARAANSSFELTDANAAAVAEICRGLDGLPLAIELAAARVAALAPADIASRLDSALHIAADGPRGASPRQQTLDATIAWSYALLDEHERRLFERLAVFGGGFTLDGAQHICPADADALAVLPRLVAKSIVQLEPQPDGAARYRLLEPLRQFAHARLSESGELEIARRLHAAHMLAMVEPDRCDPVARAVPHLLLALQPEIDNVRLALEWACAQPEPDLAARFGAALWMWWSHPDRQAEGRAWLDRIVSLPGVERAPQYGQVLVGLALLTRSQSDMAQAVILADKALHIANTNADIALSAIALYVRGTALALLSAAEAAEPVVYQSVERAREAGLTWIEIVGLCALGNLALARGDARTAEQHIRAGLRLTQNRVDTWSRAIAVTALGDLLRARGDAEQAGTAYEEALSLFTSLDPHRTYISQALLHNLGYVALAHGDVRRAASMFIDSATLYRTLGTDRRGLAECVIGLACTAVQARQPTLAARLFGSAEAELERLGTLPTPANQAAYARGLAGLAGALSPAQLEAARAEGRELPIDDAVERAGRLALGAETTSATPPAEQSPGFDLTPREYEVARMVARGLSNRQVAEELVIAEKTVKNHVLRVLDKLGVHSRTQLALRMHALGAVAAETNQARPQAAQRG
jgi:predicted ATPase/DNA-binding CsgD family transcriptional regulator/DNA-binding XRE family transcriptional regulator